MRISKESIFVFQYYFHQFYTWMRDNLDSSLSVYFAMYRVLNFVLKLVSSIFNLLILSEIK